MHFIHEDRVRQVVLLPVNKAVSLPSFAALRKGLLSFGFSICEEVHTGYGAHSEPMPHTTAFEMDLAYLFCVHGDNSVLELFADDIRPRSAHQVPDNLVSALLWLGNEYGFFIKDHDLGESCHLTNKADILHYMIET